MNNYQDIFDAQKANQFAVGNTTYKERIAKLKALKQAIEVDFKDQIREALYSDFKKPFLETDLTEIYPILSEIKHVTSELKGWMKRQKVTTPMALLGASSWYLYEPKGVCLIISPWNFPLNLTFGPLVSAIAAGNTVIIKPSELTPHTSQVMHAIISKLFPEHEIALVQGEVEVSTALLELPFHHIFFTGSPQVGKVVMKAASAHLTSVTLELGGKSPTIIDTSANLKAAATRIAWGKFVNNGQTCIAPDYVLIHEDVKDEFIQVFKTVIASYFGRDAATSNAYARIVNDRHFERLQNHIENAKQLGAKIELGGHVQEADNFIAPTIISNVPEEASVLQEEIFGPILPIKTYTAITEAIDYINSKEKPLALYMYSKNKKQTQLVINNTRAGSTCINTNVLQYSNHYLPFGGSNNSGIGKAHGIFGFQEFSNMRSVLKQHTKGSIEFLFPPYTNLKQQLVDFTLRWF
ncbi:aldehyde dehydrogenase family protein [uncultured Formosa sp.]|uniref:aldehyde dehydrogenase family protein n=1 Tax=uncultured Formosa sp. TaxID=255435 RepID=UPI002613BA57|nr:aldehyde dehydrogenase family protein [uncultured Formosa sp.]